jgi:hypothetical protein
VRQYSGCGLLIEHIDRQTRVYPRPPVFLDTVLVNWRDGPELTVTVALVDGLRVGGMLTACEPDVFSGLLDATGTASTINISRGRWYGHADGHHALMSGWWADGVDHAPLATFYFHLERLP